MQHALMLARRAEAQNEVPVGAVLVDAEQRLLAEGWNQSIQLHDPTAHAEIVALRQAGRTLNNYRLINSTLYVTLEPCAMCAGAMAHARIKRLVYGAKDPKAGAVESVFNLLEKGLFTHFVQSEGRILAEPCGELLRSFFKKKRNGSPIL
jgi:tRNA(adenine34) deaminase